MLKCFATKTKFLMNFYVFSNEVYPYPTFLIMAIFNNNAHMHALFSCNNQSSENCYSLRNNKKK